MDMTPGVKTTWLLLLGMKAFVLAIVLLVWRGPLPRMTLVLIPAAYIAVAIFAIVNRQLQAAAICFATLLVFAVLYNVPGPMQDFMRKLIHAGP